MKKLYFSLIILLFLSVFFTPAVNAEELSPVNTDITAEQNADELSILSDEMHVNSKIKKELYDSITTVYGKEKTNEIYNEVLKHAKSAIEARSSKLKEQDITRSSDWYKNEIIYMFYADSFGVKNANSQNTFKETAAMLDYLKDLGVTTLYILPFADSPMKDAGFDVKNPRNVRKDLGGLNEFKNFVSITEKDLTTDISMVKTLEELFKDKCLHEFKKAEFALRVKQQISSDKDISDEVRKIVNEIKKLSYVVI